MWLKQNTAATIKLGPFLDDADGKTAETALTISQADIRLSKNGGDIAQTNNAAGATHDELGYYDVPLDTTDTNTLGRLKVAVSESGALPVWQDFMVVPANVWDSLFGADKLQVHADEITAGLITAAAIADGAIDAATFAAGAINAAAIATDAIAAAKVAADAVTKIQTGLATPTNITAGTITTVTNLTNAPTNGDLTATMKTSVTIAATAATPTVAAVTGAVGSVTGSVGSVTGAVGSVTGAVGSVTSPVTVGTNNDKTGYALSSAGVQAIWDALTSALTTAGSIGKLLVDNINATIGSRSSHNAANVRTEMDANSTKLANLDATISSRSTLTAAQVWDTLTSALSTVGSIGKLIVDNLNATITSRMATFVYTAPPAVGDVADAIWDEATAGHTTPGTFGEQLKTDVDAILAYAGTNGVVLSTAQMQALADIVLARGSAGLDSSAAPDSLYEAIGMLLRGDTSTGQLVIKKTDGVAIFSTRDIDTDPGAVPIVGIS